MSKTKLITKKTVVVGLMALLLAAGILYILEKKQITNLIKLKKPPVSEGAETTSTTITAQENFNDGDQREAGNSLNGNEGSGGISDTSGSISGIDTSNSIVSKTGEITIYSPKQSALVKSGVTVAGSSKLSTVSYRLIDSVSGVIAEGELQVVNSRFSGTLNFTTAAKEGRLDFFGMRSDGSEFSNVEIPLRFQ